MDNNKIYKLVVLVSTTIAMISIFLPWISIYVPFIQQSVYDIDGKDFIKIGFISFYIIVILVYIVSFKIHLRKAIYVLTASLSLITAVYAVLVISDKDHQVLDTMEKIGYLDDILGKMIKDSIKIAYGFWLLIVSSIVSFVVSFFIKEY